MAITARARNFFMDSPSSERGLDVRACARSYHALWARSILGYERRQWLSRVNCFSAAGVLKAVAQSGSVVARAHISWVSPAPVVCQVGKVLTGVARPMQKTRAPAKASSLFVRVWRSVTCFLSAENCFGVTAC